uniref:Adenylate kinase active site lid domain-containing protein n=1 Tax=Haptolina brevifila TaxID=156173 RepID=A0A7S2D6S8_9EUKA|mmetsp:Transcript_33881/g.67487  ORF Transcript_33881/g.67487 Transcript_33881/m.67487 type:complete len:137 (+) Transcript_33881:1-411(+)|eukprot:CAMPEP_0174703732 /NCGR_PEP_ID=MMETSP1094-20130205/7575_1 /TAXON_ID=156173 /ORGANISM="Chrysochromulina brevifilum, Strain UTEX LB 985" /LENGTH=136 /DNA_ID=CAMNT_0015901691 /DNA_START=1 /DNA_END=411 /DNA_ORIENTATION=+
MVRAGQVVPTQVTMNLLKAAMMATTCPCLIDGFPRSVDNMETFQKQCGKSTATIVLELPEEISIERLLERGSKAHVGTDETATTVQRRVQTYQTLSLPMVEALAEQTNVHRIDASKSKEEVFKAVRAVYLKYFPAS